MSQEKLQTIVMQKLLGVIEVYYGIVQVVNEQGSRFVFGGRGWRKPNIYGWYIEINKQANKYRTEY